MTIMMLLPLNMSKAILSRNAAALCSVGTWEALCLNSAEQLCSLRSFSSSESPSSYQSRELHTWPSIRNLQSTSQSGILESASGGCRMASSTGAPSGSSQQMSGSREQRPDAYGQRPSATFQGMSRQLINLTQRQVGVISVLSTNNNTIATLSDKAGNVKAVASAGSLGFKNSRKATPHAAEAVGAAIGERAHALGFSTVEVKVKGMGFGKVRTVRELHATGIRITSVTETTPVPHNGCRLPRKRRT